MTLPRALLLVLAVTVAVALGVPASAQTVLLEEDFDAGIPAGWTTIQKGFLGDDFMPGFGLVDGSGDVNHEWFCDFGFLNRNNFLLSPPMDLTNATDVTVTFDQFQQFPQSLTYNALEVTLNDGVTFFRVLQILNPPAGFSTLSADLHNFEGQSNVRIAFHYEGVVANDWSIDNVRVTTPWADLDGCVGGPSGAPVLTGEGPGTPGSTIALDLVNAPASAPATLVAGLAALQAPFKGGVLVPQPQLLLSFVTSAGGTVSLAGPFPPGLPAGVHLYVQWWMADASGPFGFLGSNALSIVAG